MATQISLSPDELSELPDTAHRRPSALLKFGIGVAALFGFIAILLVGAQFFAPAHNRADGIWLELTPPPVVGASQTAPKFSLVKPRSLGRHLIADPALVEDSPFGPLPVVAKDGRAPMAAYARPFSAKETRRRIAIIVGGLDVSASNTKLALARLPPAVTLAFAPFASDAQTYVDRAREAGHEVLIEVPMEPFDFPESDPGSHALMVAASRDENVRRLNWSLSRATGYVGITNLLGARFMSEQKILEPVLNETARRGLIFVDNGASRSSVALTAARRAEAPFAAGTLILDEVQSRAGIDKKLDELEAEARRNGSAIGVGSAYPVTIARIAAWAEGLESHGLVLVPISALAAKPVRQP